MTTNYHTAIATGAAANAATINTPLAALDGAIGSAKAVALLPASALYSTRGTPARGSIGAAGLTVSSWLLDDATIEAISGFIEYAGDVSGSTITVNVFWAADSATSGSVRLWVGTNAIADGEDLTSAPASDNNTHAVPGTAKYLKKTTVNITESYVSGDLIGISITRDGTHAGDTASGDVHILGITVEFS